jgi:hypothetical protein
LSLRALARRFWCLLALLELLAELLSELRRLDCLFFWRLLALFEISVTRPELLSLLELPSELLLSALWTGLARPLARLLGPAMGPSRGRPRLSVLVDRARLRGRSGHVLALWP